MGFGCVKKEDGGEEGVGAGEEEMEEEVGSMAAMPGFIVEVLEIGF